MADSSPSPQLGVVRSAALVSLGLVALAGTVAVSLYRRVMVTPRGANAPPAKVSKLVLDEWEAELARLNLPSRREVEALQHQLAELEAQIDQILQKASQPKEGD